VSPATAIAPGLVATEILDSIDPNVVDALRKQNNKYTPDAPRFGSIDDIAQVVTFSGSS
jgi:3-oxoacyl-[acyl-carrier protein] reductase